MLQKLLFLLFIFLGQALYATSVSKGVDKLIEQVDPSINIGVAIVDLDTNELLYERNANRTFIPASNMKIFSDAIALMILGPDYRFKTTISTDAKKLEGGILSGNVYIKMSGDPSLNSDDIYKLLQTLKKLKVRQILGNIEISNINKSIDPYAPGWMVEDLKYSYGAPLAPITLDENRAIVSVNPGAKYQEKATVVVENNQSNITIDNRIITKKPSSNCGIDFNMDENNKLLVTGCMRQRQMSIMQGVAIKNPYKYARSVIQNQLKNLNITLRGKILLAKKDNHGILLGSHYSRPVAMLLADTIKHSDNLYADSLFLHSAYKLKGQPQNWKDAEKTLKKFIQKQTNINLKGSVLTDGSGLSRYDQITPMQTVELLKFVHNRFPMAYEFITTLPVAGFDGTLQKRFRKVTEKGLIRAKTGTMTGVTTLSGFLYTPEAHTLAFAIFINGMPGTSPKISGKYRYLVDTICGHFLKLKSHHKNHKKQGSALTRLPYLQNPTSADRQRKQYASWRNIEVNIKKLLVSNNAYVIFHGSNLEIVDNNHTPQKIWSILHELQKKHRFGIILDSSNEPNFAKNNILWIKKKPSAGNRVWHLAHTI